MSRARRRTPDAAPAEPGAWTRLLPHPAPLDRLYSRVPPLRGVRLRSVNLDRWGPTLTLRLDLPGVPDLIPADWRAAGCDTVQCQLRFLAVEGLTMTGWEPPVVVDVGLEEVPDAVRRVAVRAEGHGTRLAFTASDALGVGHVSAFQRGDDGSDEGPHRYLRPVDARLYPGTPEPYVRAFFEYL